MSETVLDRLADALDKAAGYDGNVLVPPVAVLWPDKEGQWAGSVEMLRTRRCILTLGAYDPDRGSGPAYWIRCAIAGTVDFDGPVGLPVLYLPGVSRDDLRAVTVDEPQLSPLASLQHRAQWFIQSNGKDWTVRALLTNRESGLGLNLASDAATAQALVAGLDRLVREPVQHLAGKHIDAPFVHNLLSPDPVRVLLRWIDDPNTTKSGLDVAAWAAFAAQCKSDYGFDPQTIGLIEPARQLGEAQGTWHHAWQRYRESPADYPNLPDRLRDARPMELFTATSLAWPQDNEAAEDQLRARLLDLPALTRAGACAELTRLDDRYGKWRGSVWAQLGQAPLALALEHLVTVAKGCQMTPEGSTVEELRARYTTDGWQTDLAALRAVAEVEQAQDVKAVAAALDATYGPWLDQSSKALQTAIGPAVHAGNYIATGAGTAGVGEVVVFVDGLRLDVAHLLVERLDGSDATVGMEVVLAALPTVTQTSKPSVVPVDQSQLTAGKALDACRASNGTSAGVQVLRSLLSDAGVQVLAPQETGEPNGTAWTEIGEIDHKGHDLGGRLALELAGEVKRIARRIRDLLNSGWSKVTVVTDHGWLLLPSGLPKNEGLPVAATVTKKGRCARVKDGAAVEVPTVPWHWDKHVHIAIAPGISCFETNQAYEHGGVSPQECFVPRLTVRASAASVERRADITSVKWRGLSLVVEFEDLPDGARVDLRKAAGDPGSSIAEVAKVTGGTGRMILLVADEDLEGEPAQLVIVTSHGTLLRQREVVVGRNR